MALKPIRYAWLHMPRKTPSVAVRPAQCVALAYHGGQGGHGGHSGLYAPKVVAGGNGAIAEEIIRCANEAGIYVHQSADLVRLLMRVDLDEHIPQTLYLAVAEMLAWLHRLEHPALPPHPGQREKIS